MLLISITDELQSEHVDRIEQIVAPMDVKVVRDLREDALLLKRTKILITYGHQVDRETLDLMPSLEWIQVFQSGAELIPKEILQERNILLTNIRDFHGIPMTEYTMSIILSVTRELDKYKQYQRENRWYREEYVEEIFGKTISIFGSGAIGQQIAQMCKHFGMHVIGINTSGKMKPNFDEMYTLSDKGSVLERSDFVVLLLPSTPETYHSFTLKEFETMKDSAYLINIGRGSLVKTEDLITSLNYGLIRGATIDVTEEEPLPADHDLWSAKGLTITPHVAARTVRYFDRAIDKFESNFKAVQAGEKPPYYVDTKRGY